MLGLLPLAVERIYHLESVSYQQKQSIDTILVRVRQPPP